MVVPPVGAVGSGVIGMGVVGVVGVDEGGGVALKESLGTAVKASEPLALDNSSAGLSGAVVGVGSAGFTGSGVVLSSTLNGSTVELSLGVADSAWSTLVIISPLVSPVNFSK